MTTPQRLPIVNNDDGTWGDILRQYLKKEHYDDGTDNAVNGGHQHITIRASDGTAGTAPITFSSGTLLSTPVAGAMEFHSDDFFLTQTTGTTRRKIVLYDDDTSANTVTDIHLTDPRINSIKDTSGNTVLNLGAVGGANYLSAFNAGTNNYPGLGVSGSDADVGIALVPQGAGAIQIFEPSGQDTATILADGADSDISLNLITKGSGQVKANGAEIATQAYVDSGGKLEFQHDFSDDANGNPSTADTGQSFLLSYTASGAIPTVSSGAWVNNDTTAGFSFSILEVTLNATVTYADVEFSIGAIGSGTTDGGFLALWPQVNSSTSGLWGGFVPDGLEIVFNSFNFYVNKWVSGTPTQLNEVWSGNSTITYANSLGTARQRVEYVVDKANSTLYVRAGDGNIYAFTDSFIGSSNFIYNVAEIGYGTASTDKQVAIYNWSATSAPLMGQSGTISRGRNLWEEARAAGGVVKRDGHNNLRANAFIPSNTDDYGAGGTTTMDISSTQSQTYFGTGAQTYKLPSTGVIMGQSYTIGNGSGYPVTVQGADGVTITVMDGSVAAVGIFTAVIDAPAYSWLWTADVKQIGKTLTTLNTLTLAGTDSTTMTFPSTSDTVVTLGATQTLTNKTLDNTNIATIKDTNFTLQDNSTTSKQLQFELSGISASTTRTLTVPDASGTIILDSASQILTNKTFDTASNTLKINGNSLTGTPSNTTYLRGDGSWSAAGGTSYTLQPARVATTGSETYTVSSGSVTQINGTSIDGVSPSVNDRILIKDAPSASGAGVANSSNPGNGVYSVTSNTTNLSLSRVTDMSGSVIPAALSIFVEAGTNAGNVLTVTTPSSNSAFTYGTGNIQWSKNSADAATATLTNKWIQLRTNSTASSATPAINTDTTDEFDITALAVNITSMTTNLTGSPVNGQKLMIRFKDNGTARTITWGASFVSSGSGTLLASTVANKTHRVGLIYDSTAAKWVCVAADAVGY